MVPEGEPYGFDTIWYHMVLLPYGFCRKNTRNTVFCTIWYHMVLYGVKTIWFQMRDPHKQSIPPAWTPHENHTASRHMVSGGATPTAPKRLGIWDHKGRPTIWCFAERSAAGPADQIKKEPYGRALAGGSVISWAAPTIRGGTIW